MFRLSVSATKGGKKENVKNVSVTLNGFDGDAHSGTSRALSLLPCESIEAIKTDGFDIRPGDFGENITTVGVDFGLLDVGTKIALGDSVIIEIVQVGKDCHHGCEIKESLGDCIMPRQGLFARVLAEGELNEGDPIRIIE
ncbi:MAG: MOSC domain-containing protein [Candidatus Zixiibacteriota bacterium]|nr:MAG: MOSC domain-containing protein [candidate division Zixibacteria bacterium]